MMLSGWLWTARLLIVALAAVVSVVRSPRRVGDHYFCGTRCRPPSSRAWTQVGSMTGRWRWWRLAWRRVDHVFFLAWWHWHFVAGIRWYQVFANVVAAFMDDHPLLRSGRTPDERPS